jgi:hypothetical protein
MSRQAKSHVRGPARAAVLLLLLAGCSDDGGEAATSTTSLDPGVTFSDDITVPTDTAGRPTVPPTTVGDVTSTPGEIPEGFPEDFPIPEGAEVEIGSTGHAEGEQRLAVDLTLADTRPARVLDFYREAVDEAGWAVLLDDQDGRGQDFVGQLVFETDTFVGNVLVAADRRGDTILTLTATVPD